MLESIKYTNRWIKVVVYLVAAVLFLVFGERTGRGDNELTCQAPAITLQPDSNESVCQGCTATFTAAASGAPSPSVQWQVSTDGGTSYGNITGANSTTYAFTVSTAYNGNKYRAIFANDCGTATFSGSTLTVLTDAAVVITANPTPQTACENHSASFSVTATHALSYQWRKNGFNLANGGSVSGANSSTLTLNNVTASGLGDALSHVTVYGANQGGTAWGVVTSSVAYIYQATGCVRFSDSSFSNPNGNISQDSCTTFSSQGITGGGDPFVCPGFTNWSLVGKVGSNCIQMGKDGSFVAPATGTLVLHFNDNYPFADNANSWDAAVGISTNVAEFDVVVANNCYSSTSSVASLTVTAVPATPSASYNSPVCVGSTLSLSTPVVSGAAYLWTGQNGFTSSERNPTVSTTATTGMSGTYSVTVTVNGCTSVAGSTTVTVNTIPATPSASNDGPVCAGTTLHLSTPFVTGATYHWTGPNGFTSELQNPSIENAQVAAAGTYIVKVTVNGCMSPVGTTTVTIRSPPAVSTNPTSLSVFLGGSASFTALANGNPSPSVKWQVSIDNGGTFTDIAGATATTYAFTAGTSDNGKKYRAVFANTCGTATSSAATLTVNGVNRLIVDGSSPENLGPVGICAGSSVTLRAMPSVAGAPFPAGSPVWTITSQPNGPTVANPPAGSATATIIPIRTGSYVIRAACGSSYAEFTISGSPAPVITGQPTSTTKTYGQPATFTVQATGPLTAAGLPTLTYQLPTLTYQWRRNGINISGATSSSYAITKPAVADSGSWYDVVVFDCLSASVTSGAGTLTVNAAGLNITGGSLTMATSAAIPPLTGTVTGLVPNDGISVGYFTSATANSPAGTYPIIPTISDPLGKLVNYTLTLNNGTLTVVDGPMITVQPISINRAPLTTSTAAFTVQAIGSQTLTYRWSKGTAALSDDGAHITGSTTSTLTIHGISNGDAGSYSVSVQNAAGTAYSASATLTVSDPAVVQGPATQYAVPGGTVVFNVSAQSTCSPPGYQWKKDGTALSDGIYWPNPPIASNIVGSTSASLSLTNIRAGAAGSYGTAVTCGQITSASPAGTLQVCDLYPIAMSTNTVFNHKNGDSITVQFSNNPVEDGVFGWLSWVGVNDEPTLGGSFDTPDSYNYVNPIDHNPEPPVDVGKLVTTTPGTKDTVLSHIADPASNLLNREMAIVVWDQYNSTYSAFRVYSFARITITAVNPSGGNKSLTFTYNGVGRCIDLCMPPIITLPSGNQTLTYVEKQSPQIIDSQATMVDYDDQTFPGGLLTVDFSANGLPEDAVSIRNQGTGSGQIGVTTVSGTTIITYGGVQIGNIASSLGGDLLEVAFNSSASREAVTALLQNLTYQDTSCNPSTLNRTLRIVMSDGGGCVGTPVTKPIQVVPVNDPPTLVLSTSNISIPSCGGPVPVQFNGITGGCDGSQVGTITANSSIPSLIPNPTVTYTPGAETGTLTLTPTGTGFGGPVTITVTVKDNGGTLNGGLDSGSATFTVNVLDCAPVIAFQSSLTFTEHNSPSIIDAAFQLSDPDSPNFSGGSLTVSLIQNGETADQLGILSAGSISVSSGTISYNSAQIGSFTGGAGTTPLVISFNANATVPAVQALARNLTYYNGSETPSTQARTVQAVMDDGAGGISAPMTTSIFVIRVNDPPVANPHTYSVVAGQTLTVPAANGVLVSDTDPDGDTLTATVVNGSGASYGTLTLSPDGSFVYQSNPGTTAASDTFTYRATDNGTPSLSATAVVTINITPAAPTCTAPALTSLQLASSSVPGGTTVNGTVTLAAPTTLTGGQVIKLESTLGVAIPPISVLVPKGSAQASFTIQTLAVSSLMTSTIKASDLLNQSFQTGTLTITAPGTGGTGLPGDVKPGFTFSVLIDNIPTISNEESPHGLGPMGLAENSVGKIFVASQADGNLAILPDVDGQHYDSPTTPKVLTGGIFGLARLGNTTYGILADNGGIFYHHSNILTLGDDGTIVRSIDCPNHLFLLALAANPKNGLLYATDWTADIFEIDPASGAFRLLAYPNQGNFDGIAVSADGESIYVADQQNQSSNPNMPMTHVRGYDISSGANIMNVAVVPPKGGLVDGMAVGHGSLSGLLFVNCTHGELMTIDLQTGNVSTFSSGPESRGDFVAVDDDGSLLITESSSVLRLTPPPGGGFSPVQGTIVTRNDITETYTPFTLGTTLEAISQERNIFDVRGISGNVVSGSMARAGSVGYADTGGFEIQYGVASFNSQNANSYPPPVLLGVSNPGISSYSPTWSLPAGYLQDLQLSLGGDYETRSADRISSICGTVSLTDAPQAHWPQTRNTLTFLATGTNEPQIEVGSSLDLALLGTDPPTNGDWDIVLDGEIIASSGNTNGWNVELDQTSFLGAIVTVPLSATIAPDYEVRVAALSKSGNFEVVPASSIVRAPTLLPIGLSVNPVQAGSSVNVTISLDQEAPPPGVSVAISSDNSSVSVPATLLIPTGTKAQTISVPVASGAVAGTANINASYNGARRVALQICTGGFTAPSAPAAVSAAAGTGSVKLNWTPTSGVTYNIKRSMVSGGPYTTIFAGLKNPPYFDTSVVNGQTYYYVISGQNCAGEGNSSGPVSATPSLGQVAVPTLSYFDDQYTGDYYTLVSATIGAFIHYTLDSTEPTEGSPLTLGAFPITSTTIVKAKAFKKGYLPSDVLRQTVTVSVTLNPSSFFGLPCGSFYVGSLSPYPGDRPGPRSWVRGQAFYAEHFTVQDADGNPGNFTAGSKIKISMVSDEVNSSLYLFNESGTVVASNDDDGSGGINASIVYTVPSAGHTYYLETTSSTAGQSGSYVLFMDCGTTPPQIAVTDPQHNDNPISNGQTITVGPASPGGLLPGTTTKYSLTINNVATLSTASGLHVGLLQMAGDFAVDPQPIPVLPPLQSSGTITVRLLASGLGAKHGVLVIPSDDPANNPFVINLVANVVDPTSYPSVVINSPSCTPQPGCVENIPDDTFQNPGSILITTTPTPAGYPIAKVEFFANAVKIGQVTAAPYSLTWVGAQPGNGAQPAPYQLTAKVTDTAGRQGTTAAATSITVSAPILSGTPFIWPGSGSNPGSVSVMIYRDTLPEGATIIYTTGTGASAQWHVYDVNSGLPLVFTSNDASSGSGSVTLQTRGVMNGAYSSIASATYTFTSGSCQPTATISTPANGSQITNPVSVMGSAIPCTSGGSVSWRLDYHVHGDDSSPWISFATSSYNFTINSTAFDPYHPFDPTLLLNGLYDIRLTVVDSGGGIYTSQVTVEVVGRQKVGNFTLSFVDMTVPVAGVPIQVTRTYDSRDKGQGDFGIGWRLSTSNVKVEESGTLGTGWDQAQISYIPPRFEMQPTSSHRVTITFPGDKVYSFEATLDPPALDYETIISGTVVFQPLAGTHGSLVPVGVDPNVDVFPGDVGASEFDDTYGNPFNPQEFDLTTSDGRVFRVKVGSGLEYITDLNGNVTTFQSDGIYMTTASLQKTQIIGYSRENGGLNRITAITDPNGKSVLYYYGTGGQGPLDLSTVVDRVNTSTTYSYDAVHNLVDIIAPNGSHGVRTVYDDSGRITQTADANNNTTTYSYGDHFESITDPLNNTTTLTYDGNGNVIQKSQRLIVNGQPTTITTASEFADPNNPSKPTKITDPLGRTSTMKYSADGTLLSRTDPLTNTTSYTYNDYGQMTSVTDARHQTSVQNVYDNISGNLLSSTDANDAQTTSTYNPDGTLASTTDALGHKTQYSYGGQVTILNTITGGGTLVLGDPGGTGQATTITDANNHQTQFVYDKNGNQTHVVITRTLNNGSIETIDTVNQYDDSGNLTNTTVYAHVPGQAVQSQVQVQNFYNEIGKLEHTVDYTGQQTKYFYDASGSLTNTVTPDGNSKALSYDANHNLLGMIISSADGKALTNSYTYDNLGRQTSVTFPDGSTTFQKYDTAGQLTTNIDANGNVTQSEYDNAGRNTRVLDALGHATTYEYDEIGRRVSVTDANLNKTIYTYDNVGRLLATTFPKQNGATITRSTAYDALGQKTNETDEAGLSTGYGYDVLGRLTSVTNAINTGEQAVTTYSYDEVGNLTHQFDARQNGSATVFDYDFLGRRVQRTLPDGLKSEQTAYNVVQNPAPLHIGNVLEITLTDFNGNKTTVTNDVMGRVVAEMPDPGSGLPAAGKVPVQFTYDSVTGQRATMTDASGTTTYLYDTMGRLTNKTHSVLGGLSYTYDPVGNLLAIQDSSHTGGVFLTNHWDKLNRLVQVDDNSGKSTTYDYDKVGNLQDFTYPTTTPVKTTYNYNNLNRLTDISVSSGGGTLALFNYNPADRLLNPTGVRMAERGTINAATTISRSVNYSYDHRYRLTDESIINNGPAIQPAGTIDYTAQTVGAIHYNGYDAVGNRQSRVINLTAAIGGFATGSSTFDVDDRLTTSTYDANGNTTVETVPALATLSQAPVSPTSGSPDQYDFQNHLIKRSDGTTSIQIIYDGDGNRVGKTVNGTTTYYLVDDRNPSGYAQVLEELAPNGGPLQVNRVYNYGHGLISQYRRNSNNWAVSYYGYDGQGNVRFLMDSGGTITDTYTYDAFGVLLNSTGTTPNNYLYCGEQYDFDLGLSYNCARYLNPAMGRFWTTDINEGEQEDPVSLHKYLYAANEPVGFADKTGYSETPATALGRRVHAFLGMKFKGESPNTRISNRGIRAVLQGAFGDGYTPPGGWQGNTRKRPDLVEWPANKKGEGSVYEIKPGPIHTIDTIMDFDFGLLVDEAMDVASGDQLSNYLRLLQQNTRKGTITWGPGTSWHPGFKGWPEFTDEKGRILVTLGIYKGYGDGVILYEFVPSEQEQELAVSSLAAYAILETIKCAIRTVPARAAAEVGTETGGDLILAFE